MTAIVAPADNEAGRRGEHVLAWRELRLLEMGLPPLLAGPLARDRRLDLHQFEALRRAGCPAELAARILSE